MPHKIQLFLWKLEAGALPINDDLHTRLGGEFFKECPRCRGIPETINHIFWTSLEAKSIWNMVANWWALDFSQRSKLGNSLKETLSIFKGKIISTVWKTSISAILWSIWLRRNNLIFNNFLELVNSTVDMVKFRSFKWSKAELNFPEEIYNLWQVNPLGATMLHSKHGLFQDLVRWNAEFHAYTDGSWAFLNSEHKAGIGGCIPDRNQNLLFIFSGPSMATSPREAERDAIFFAFKAFSSQRTVQGRLQIRTDCLTLVNDFQRQRAGNGKLHDHAAWVELINNPNIKVCFSPRDSLLSAHELAAQGVRRARILQAWC